MAQVTAFLRSLLRPLEMAELTLSVAGGVWLVLHCLAGMGRWPAVFPAALAAVVVGRWLWWLAGGTQGGTRVPHPTPNDLPEHTSEVDA